MPSITFLESGTDATQGFEFWSATAGTVSSATDQVKTGPRSIKLTTGSPALASAQKSGVLADAGRRISLWFRGGTLPAAESNLLLIEDAADNTVAQVRWRTDGKLSFGMVGATFVTGSTTLSINTWYRLAVSYTITNTTTFRIDVYVDGVNQGSATAGTATRTGSDILQVTAASALGNGINVWYDDVYIDDGADYTDPGDIRVTNKRPNANGGTNTFDTTTSTTNSGYGTGNSICHNTSSL